MIAQVGQRNGQCLHVVQGDFIVADDASVMLTTVLGSCVSACIRDPKAEVGGMNHFLLPGEGQASDVYGSVRYGVHAMELLINALLKRGAQRNRLEAKLFGGAHLFVSNKDVGAQNADFAERFLRSEGLKLISASLRGHRARRVQYWPVSGRARQIILTDDYQSAAAPVLGKVSFLLENDDVELF